MTIQETFFPEPTGSIEDRMITELYDLYPRKKGRPAAFRAIRSALSKISFQELRKIVAYYADCVSTWEPKDIVFVPYPSTWFNQERWTDDASDWIRGSYKESKAKSSTKSGEYEYEHRVKTL